MARRLLRHTDQLDRELVIDPRRIELAALDPSSVTITVLLRSGQSVPLRDFENEAEAYGLYREIIRLMGEST